MKKKYFLWLSCFIWSAAVGYGQVQSTGRPAVRSSAVSSQVNAARQANAEALRAARAAAGINTPLGGSRVSGVFPGGSAGTIPFGGEQNIQFGGTNTGTFINDPRVNLGAPAPLGVTNEISFGRNPVPFIPMNSNESVIVATGAIIEPSGAITDQSIRAAQPGIVAQVAAADVALAQAQSSVAVDAAFGRALNAALARGGATRILFPKTSTAVTFVNQNGAILLQGNVADEAEKRVIEERVKSSPDVIAVENQLRVVPDPRRPINVMQFNDALSRAGATQVLFPETSTPVTVVNQNGSILLTGVVADETERRKIEESARSSPDVIAVNSQLQVASTETKRF